MCSSLVPEDHTLNVSSQESHQTGNDLVTEQLDSASLASDEGVREEAFGKQWNLIFWATGRGIDAGPRF